MIRCRQLMYHLHRHQTDDQTLVGDRVELGGVDEAKLGMAAAGELVLLEDAQEGPGEQASPGPAEEALPDGLELLLLLAVDDPQRIVLHLR